MKNYKTNNSLHPEVKKLLTSLEGVSLKEMGVDKAREFLTRSQTSVEYDMSGAQIEKANIAGVRCYIISPNGNPPSRNIVVFIHGGGWVLSHFRDYERMVRDMVLTTGKTFVYIEYDLSPESRYNIALKQIFNVCEVLHNDCYNLSIIGNSAGGNMAIAITRECIRHNIKINSMIAMWPVCSTTEETESWEEFAEGYYLSTKDMNWFIEQYAPHLRMKKMLNLSVLSISSQELSQFPPTLIQVSENDILRDEGEMMGDKLMNAGCDASTIRYNGVIHDWGFLNQLKDLPQTKLLYSNTACFINNHFQ